MSQHKKVSYVNVLDASSEKSSVVPFTRKWRFSKLVRKIKNELKLNDNNFKLTKKDGRIIESIKDVNDNEQLYVIRADTDSDTKTSIYTSPYIICMKLTIYMYRSSK